MAKDKTNNQKGEQEQKTPASATKEGGSVVLADLKPGMTVRIHQRIKELNMKKEEKERVQYFEGMVIGKKHNKETGGTVTVRRVSEGVGVEKIFPVYLPTIDKVEILKQAKVRRSKLYFLKRGYRKKFKETRYSKK